MSPSFGTQRIIVRERKSDRRTMDEMNLERIYVRIPIRYDETDWINDKFWGCTEVLIKLNGTSVCDDR